MADHKDVPRSVFWQHAVRALAKAELPEFDGDADAMVKAAFEAVFSSYRMDPGAIAAALIADVNEASGGRVRLELADPSTFWRQAMCSPAVYLRLITDDQRRLLIFAPWATPFEWDEGPSYADQKITEAEFSELRSASGDRMVVDVTLEDGSTRRLLDVPTGRLHLARRNVVGRTVAAAHAQAMCWLEAADDGIHRIIGVEKIGPIAEDDPDLHRSPGLNGNWEVVVRMSDGTSVRAFTFYEGEVSFTPEELLDLSLEQAVELKVQDGFNYPDYSTVRKCLCCGRNH